MQREINKGNAQIIFINQQTGNDLGNKLASNRNQKIKLKTAGKIRFWGHAIAEQKNQSNENCVLFEIDTVDYEHQLTFENYTPKALKI